MKTSSRRTDTQTINIFSASYEIERRLCNPGDRREVSQRTRSDWSLQIRLVCCSPVHKQTSRKVPMRMTTTMVQCMCNKFFSIYFRLVSLEDVFNSNVEWWKQDLHTALCFVSQNRRNFPSFPYRLACIFTSVPLRLLDGIYRPVS